MGRLPQTVIVTLKYILLELEQETFMVSTRRPLKISGDQFRTDAKCSDGLVILAGWELESRRWFSLRVYQGDAPYLFKPGIHFCRVDGHDVGVERIRLVACRQTSHIPPGCVLCWHRQSGQRGLDAEAGNDQVATDGLEHADVVDVVQSPLGPESPGKRTQRQMI